MRIFSVFLILALGIAAPGGAEGPKPFPEFEAKRVKPPTAGVGKRIKVQIAPSAPAPAAPAAPAQKAAQQNPEGGYPWFWEKLRPEAEGAGPGRLQAALKVLAAQGAAVPSPRLQQLQDIAKANGIDILRATVGTNVSPALVLAVIAVESSGQPNAQSRAGAQGLMQLMPDTAARFGVADSFDPAQNISGGVKYLDWLMGTFDSDPILVLAGYNAGEGSLRKHGGVPPFAETRDYVPKVLAAFQTARGLCLTPPELISDGCVFAAMK